MQRRTLLQALPVFILFSALLYQGNAQFDYESDISSWPRLKRQTGYRTESGRYRGGLYKDARDEEREFYHCLKDNKAFCTEWSTQETSTDEEEVGTCICREKTGTYCSMWTCSQIEIGFTCEDCPSSIQGEVTTCVCDKTSLNETYCEEWSCTERGTDGALEYEEYRCLKEDKSGEFCFRWKGDITSDREVESSVCQCTKRQDRYCEVWQCVERGLVRCSKHYGAWCNFWIGVFVAGGLGLLFLTIGGVIGGFALVSGNDRAFCSYYACGLLIGLPWIAAVVIWGGERAWPYVVPVWGVAIIFPLFFFIMMSRSGPSSPPTK